MNTPPSAYLYHEEIYQFGTPVTVITSRPWHKILDDEKVLLGKILGSVKLTLDTVRVSHTVSMESLRLTGTSRVLLFGTDLLPEIRSYEVVDVSGVSVLKADDLNLLDDTRKKNLWTGLKQMFSV